MNKKAQIKMFENVGVLVVFFFLVAFGSIMYFKYQNAILDAENSKIIDAIAFQTAEKVFHLPELDCSYAGAVIQGCIDKLKLDIFQESLKRQEVKSEYYDTFKDSAITIQEIYPAKKDSVVLYDQIPKSWGNKIKKFMPLLIFNPLAEGYCHNLKGKCTFAILEVDNYSP